MSPGWKIHEGEEQPESGEGLREIQWRYHDLRQEKAGLITRNRKLQKRIDAIESSSSWRIARFFLDPLDSLREFLRGTEVKGRPSGETADEKARLTADATTLVYLSDPGRAEELASLLGSIQLARTVRVAAPFEQEGCSLDDTRRLFKEELPGRDMELLDSSFQPLSRVFMELSGGASSVESLYLVLIYPELEPGAISRLIGGATGLKAEESWKILREHEGVDCVTLEDDPEKSPFLFWAESQSFRLMLESVSGGCYGQEDDDVRGFLGQLLESGCFVDTESFSYQELRHRTRKEFRRFLDGEEIIAFPEASNPVVSIVVVVYNQADLTLECLRSIRGSDCNSYELIIFDNNSTDRTAELFDRVKGTRLIRSNCNLGYIKAVNQAAVTAGGEYLLLLNNDTVFPPDAVSRAVSVMRESGEIGAVGARLVFPDGTLQEAGAIVFNDATTLGYGRGKDPDAGEFQFRRDVDYCCGAFLLLRRKQFLEMGGFDEDFSPAYYEENDYCLKLRRSGFRVVYEPSVSIWHVERASAPSVEKCLEQMDRNRVIYLGKNREFLDRNHLTPGEENILLARSVERGRTRILLVDDHLPLSENGAGFPRTAAVLESLVDCGNQVTYYSTVPETSPDWPLIRRRFPPGVEFILDRGNYHLADFLEERRGFYDVLWICRPHNQEKANAALERVFGPDEEKPFLIYDAEAVFALREAAAAEIKGERLTAEARQELLSQELRIAEGADLMIAVNDQEAGLFSEAYPDKPVHVLAYQIDGESFQPRGFPERRDILFIGRLDYEGGPNVDSLRWFIREVFPEIRERLPGRFSLKIVGKAEVKLFRQLDLEGVEFLGALEDLEPLYSSARVFVAPTRFAAGIPIKVMDAAAAGIPVVCTTLLARQLGWSNEREVLTADSASEFAAQVLRLYQDADLWERIGAQSRRRAGQDFSEERFGEEVSRIVSAAVK